MEDKLNLIAQTIFDKKGFNVTVLDVRGISSISDYVIIAEGNIDRHCQAIARAIVEGVRKAYKIKPTYTEGLESAEWIIIDYSDIMVHLFTPDLREQFSLEKLWEKAKEVDVKIDTKGIVND